MSTMYLVQGVGHSFTEDASKSLELNRNVEEWSKQWTTPNNTRMYIDENREAVTHKFKDDKFYIPSTFKGKDIEGMIQFKIEITKFCDGVEKDSWFEHVYKNKGSFV